MIVLAMGMWTKLSKHSYDHTAVYVKRKLVFFSYEMVIAASCSVPDCAMLRMV